MHWIDRQLGTFEQMQTTDSITSRPAGSVLDRCSLIDLKGTTCPKWIDAALTVTWKLVTHRHLPESYLIAISRTHSCSEATTSGSKPLSSSSSPRIARLPNRSCIWPGSIQVAVDVAAKAQSPIDSSATCTGGDRPHIPSSLSLRVTAMAISPCGSQVLKSASSLESRTK